MKERILTVAIFLLFLEGYLLANVFPALLAFCLLAYLTYIRLEFQPEIEASRKIENWMEEGKRYYCELRVKNKTEKEFKVAVLENLPPGFECENPVFELKGGEEKTIRYWIVPKRGKYRIKGPTLKIVDAREIYCKDITLREEVEIDVMPSVERIREEAAAEENIRLATAFRKTGIESIELDTLRKYQMGDDFRHIEWKATARLGELIVKEFLKEVEEDVYIVLDAGREMRKGVKNSKIDYATTLVLQLAYALRKYKVGLIVYDDFGVVKIIEPSKQPLEKFSRVLDVPPMQTGLIAVRVPEFSVRTTLSDFAKTIIPLIKRRRSFASGLIEASVNIRRNAYLIFIADITSHTSELIKVLLELKKRHKILLITPNPVLFYDVSKLDKEKVLWLYRRYVEREEIVKKLNRIVPTLDLGPSDLIEVVREAL